MFSRIRAERCQLLRSELGPGSGRWRPSCGGSRRVATAEARCAPQGLCQPLMERSNGGRKTLKLWIEILTICPRLGVCITATCCRMPAIAFRLSARRRAGHRGARRHFRASHRRRAAGEGWWPEIVGPGLGVDTRRFRVLGIDYLGGRGGSSTPDGGKFPPVSSYDQAEALCAVVRHLGLGAACHRRRLLWRHGGAVFRRALRRSSSTSSC
jgi:hypothetical protein